MHGAIYNLGRENRGDGHYKALGSLLMAAGLKPPLIKLLLTPLDRSWFLVSKMEWNLKIQRLDQKLWLSKVYGELIGASFLFHDISTVSIPIMTHE